MKRVKGVKLQNERKRKSGNKRNKLRNRSGSEVREVKCWSWMDERTEELKQRKHEERKAEEK